MTPQTLSSDSPLSLLRIENPNDLRGPCISHMSLTSNLTPLMLTPFLIANEIVKAIARDCSLSELALVRSGAAIM